MTNISCPLCKKCIYNKTIQEQISRQIDAAIAGNQMPEEYRNKLMYIQCNDCLAKSWVPFHIDGGKCKECGFYNTTRLKEKLIDAPQTD